MSETKIVSNIKELDKNTNNISGAIYTNTGILKSPIDNLVTVLDNASNKTEKLTKALVFWTKIMALAVIGQIIVIILTNFF